MKKIVFYIRDFFCGLCMAIAACGMFSCSDFLDEESHHALPDTQNWKTLEDVSRRDDAFYCQEPSGVS